MRPAVTIEPSSVDSHGRTYIRGTRSSRSWQSPRSWQRPPLPYGAMGRTALLGRSGRYTFVSASVEPVSYWSLTPWRRNDPILTSLSPSDPSYLAAPRPARRERPVQRCYPGYDHRRSEGGCRRRRRHGDQRPERRNPPVGHNGRRRFSSSQPRPWGVSGRGRQAGIPQRAARVGQRRHQ